MLESYTFEESSYPKFLIIFIWDSRDEVTQPNRRLLALEDIVHLGLLEHHFLFLPGQFFELIVHVADPIGIIGSILIFINHIKDPSSQSSEEFLIVGFDGERI